MKTLSEFRADRMQQAMRDNNLDVLVASLPEHILYVLGFTILGPTYQAKTQNYAVWSPSSPRKYLAISPSDAPTALEYDPEVELVCHGGFQFDSTSRSDLFVTRVLDQIAYRAPSPADALIEAVTRCHRNPRRIGLDELRTPATTWKRVEAAFPQAEVIPAMAIFEDIRCVKHPDEIRGIEAATRIAEDAMLSALQGTQIGDTEHDLVQRYRLECRKRKAHGYFCTCTVDYRTAFSDTRPRSDARIKDGSIIRLDFGATLDFFRSDLARTVSVGSGNIEAEETFSWMYRGLLAAEAVMRPRALACQVYETAMAAVREGVPSYKRHHCGHGIGLQIYDPLPITADCRLPLMEGMVFCIETPYYRLGDYGVQTEDTVAVTEDGIRRLSHTSCDLIRILRD